MGDLAGDSLTAGDLNSSFTTVGQTNMNYGCLGAGAGPLVVTGTGPHSVGGSTTTNTELGLLGSFSPTGAAPIAFSVTTTLTAGADSGNIDAVSLAPTLVERAAGTHTRLSALTIAPSITNGAASTTTAAGLAVLTFAAGAGTTNAASLYVDAVPTGATNNYALWAVTGAVRIDGLVPHSIGGATNTRYALYLTGTQTMSGATQEAGFALDQALTNASGVSLYGVFLNQTLTNVAGATTTMAWQTINPSALTITAGSVTNAAGLYITGAPSGATNNYALWVAGGAVRVDGAGPHAIGGATNSIVSLLLTGSGASASNPEGVRNSMSLTAGSGGTTLAAIGRQTGNTITTAAAAFTLTDGVGLLLEPPTLSLGAGSAITNASTLKVTAAPSGATNNYALWVAGGTAKLDGNVQANSLGVGVAASGTAGRLTVNENLIVSGTGPHAIGGATSNGQVLGLLGDVTGNASFGNFFGVEVGYTLRPVATQDASLFNVDGTIAKAGSGTHATLAGVRINAPQFIAGAALITDVAGLWVNTFTAPASTTNASAIKIVNAPTSGTNNYALWGAAGAMRWDGTIFGGTTLTLASLSGSSMLFGRVASIVPGAFSEDMRLISGVLALGTTVTTSAVAGSFVMPNNIPLRGVNAAATDTIDLIRVNASNVVAIRQTGGDILWGTALVALGAGGAATLGNTGGSGPATTTQNTWMRVIDSTGAAFWVPAWK